jgi:hypothetical protein
MKFQQRAMLFFSSVFIWTFCFYGITLKGNDNLVNDSSSSEEIIIDGNGKNLDNIYMDGRSPSQNTEEIANEKSQENSWTAKAKSLSDKILKRKPAQVKFKPVVIDGVTIDKPDSITADEIVNWTSTGVGVSKELIEAYFTKNTKTLGRIGHILTALSVGKALYEDNDKAALLGILNWAAAEMISKMSPETSTFLTYFQAYVTGVQLLHSGMIKYMKGEVFKAYCKSRIENPAWSPLEVCNNMAYFTRELKIHFFKQVLSEKYNMTENDLTERFRERIQKEAELLMARTFEEMYLKEKLLEDIETARKNAQKNREKYIEEIKQKLKMPVHGIVVDAKTKKRISGVQIGIEGVKKSLTNQANGTFKFRVQYKTVNGKDFYVYARKGKFYQKKQVTWKSPRPPFLTFNIAETTEKQPQDKKAGKAKLSIELEISRDKNNYKLKPVFKEQNGIGITLQTQEIIFTAQHQSPKTYHYPVSIRINGNEQKSAPSISLSSGSKATLRYKGIDDNGNKIEIGASATNPGR